MMGRIYMMGRATVNSWSCVAYVICCIIGFHVSKKSLVLVDGLCSMLKGAESRKPLV